MARKAVWWKKRAGLNNAINKQMSSSRRTERRSERRTEMSLEDRVARIHIAFAESDSEEKSVVGLSMLLSISCHSPSL